MIIYKAIFRKRPVWSLSKDEKVALRQPHENRGSRAKWRFVGYSSFERAFLFENIYDGSVRYLDSDKYVYIYF